jgi:hypothetical protein
LRSEAYFETHSQEQNSGMSPTVMANHQSCLSGTTFPH